eukprot:3940339-Rhodomonas_salina.2
MAQLEMLLGGAETEGVRERGNGNGGKEKNKSACERGSECVKERAREQEATMPAMEGEEMRHNNNSSSESARMRAGGTGTRRRGGSWWRRR